MQAFVPPNPPSQKMIAALPVDVKEVVTDFEVYDLNNCGRQVVLAAMIWACGTPPELCAPRSLIEMVGSVSVCIPPFLLTPPALEDLFVL